MDDNNIIDIVLQFEGGFVNNAADHGGPTNFGITAATLGSARKLGRVATVDEVRNLPRNEAAAIYKASYLTGPGFDNIQNVSTRLVLVDTGVLHGTGRSIAYLRQCLGMPATPKPMTQLNEEMTQAVTKRPDPGQLAGHLLSLRLKSYTSIVAKDRTQLQFMGGWVNRVAALLEQV
jgi:lysozyme family protein